MDPYKKVRKWGVIFDQCRFPLYCVKLKVKSLNKGYTVDKYVVINMTWSGLYMSITFSNNIIQKVLTIVSMIVTVTKFYTDTMKPFSPTPKYFRKTIYHLKIIKLKSWMVDNFTDLCNEKKILRALIVLYSLSLITLDTTLLSLRIMMVLYLIFFIHKYKKVSFYQ